MDPNANMKRQREIADFLVREAHTATATSVRFAAAELAELILAYARWRASDGFEATV